jgi:hypothetical protein
VVYADRSEPGCDRQHRHREFESHLFLRENMNDLPRNLRSKRSPGGKLRELCAGVAERLCTRLLLGDHVGSTPTACTMGLVVVRTAHPCGGQQVRTRAWPSGEATVLHTVDGSSILSARTNRMPGAAREARQPLHAGAARMEERLFHTQKAVGSIPTTGTVRRRRSVMVAFLSRRSSMEELAISTRTDAGSSPVVGSGHRRRHVSLSRRSSMDEQAFPTRKAVGSIPTAGTKICEPRNYFLGVA